MCLPGEASSKPSQLVSALINLLPIPLRLEIFKTKQSVDQKTYHNSHRNIRDWTNKYLSCLSRSVPSSINWCESVVKNNPVAGKQCSWWWWSTAWGEVFQDWLQLYTMGIMPLSWEITSPTNWIPWGCREGDIVILYLYSVLSTLYLCSLHVT